MHIMLQSDVDVGQFLAHRLMLLLLFNKRLLFSMLCLFSCRAAHGELFDQLNKAVRFSEMRSR